MTDRPAWADAAASVTHQDDSADAAHLIDTDATRFGDNGGR